MPPVVVDSLLIAGFVAVILFWCWAEFVFDRAVKPFLIQDPLHPSKPSLQGFRRPTTMMARLWMRSAYAKEDFFSWEEKMAVVRRHRTTSLVCAGIIVLILILGFRQAMLEDKTWFPRTSEEAAPVAAAVDPATRGISMRRDPCHG